jgi:drug/metabolite transporter (DMT)-like permease
MILPSIFRTQYSASLLLILAALGWSGNAIVGRLAVGEISPATLVSLRWAMVVMIVLVLYNRQMIAAWPSLRPRVLWVFLMGGIGLGIFSALLYISAHTTTAVNLGIIQSTIPGMIIFGSFLFFSTRINIKQSAGLIATLAGVVIVVSKGQWSQIASLAFSYGDVLMLIACLFYSGYALGLKDRPQINSMVMMGYFALAAWVATIPMVAIEHVTIGIMMPSSAKGWLILLYAAIVASFLSHAFFMKGVDIIGSGPAGLYVNLVPVFASIMAVIILNESLQIYHLAALIFVLSGIYLFESKNNLDNR